MKIYSKRHPDHRVKLTLLENGPDPIIYKVPPRGERHMFYMPVGDMEPKKAAKKVTKLMSKRHPDRKPPAVNTAFYYCPYIPLQMHKPVFAEDEAGKLMGDLIDISGSTAIRNVIMPISTTQKFEDLGEAFWKYQPADEEQIMKEFALLKQGFISRGHFLKTMGFTEGNFE